jgi:hypothetical protein
MAYISTVKPVASLSSILARPFVAIWNFMILMAESHPKMEEVRKLNAKTDEDLAARGTSREAEVRRIFSDRLYL